MCEKEEITYLFFAKYPDIVKAGSVSNKTISLINFFATIKNIFSNTERGTEDSYSFLSVLLGDETNYERPSVIHHSGSGKFRIRKGDWKMVEGLGSGGFTDPQYLEPKPGAPNGQLYNMKNNPQETKTYFFLSWEKYRNYKHCCKRLKDIKTQSVKL